MEDEITRETVRLMDELHEAHEEDARLIEHEVKRQLTELALLDRPASNGPTPASSSISPLEDARRAQAWRQLEDERRELLRLREEVDYHHRRATHGPYAPPYYPPPFTVPPPMLPAVPYIVPAPPVAPTVALDVEGIIRRSIAEVEVKLSASVAQLRAEKAPVEEDAARLESESNKDMADRLLAMENRALARDIDTSVQLQAGKDKEEVEAAQKVEAAAGAASVAEAVNRRLADVERMLAELQQPKSEGREVAAPAPASGPAGEDEAVTQRLADVERRVVGEIEGARRAAVEAADEARRVAGLLAEKERRVEDECNHQALAQARDDAARQVRV